MTTDADISDSTSVEICAFFNERQQAVVRLARGHAAGAMLAYVTSILAVLLGGALIAAIVGPIAVWHPFFYVISVTLPYQGRSGLVLAPLITILSGLAGTRHHQGISDAAGPLDRSGQFK